MKLQFFRPYLFPLLISHAVFSSSIGLGQEQKQDSDQTLSADSSSGTQISDGNTPVQVSDGAVTIVPPAGWEVLPDYMGKSLVLQAPKQEQVSENDADLKKPIYQPNITVAVRHQPVPIDKYQAEQLRNELKEAFGSKNNSFVTSGDHKFFDFKGQKDGLISYSFLELNGFPMTQMHVLVSGQEKSVLVTYTDLSDGFEQRMEAIWPSISSVRVEGIAPSRLDAYRSWAIAGGGVLVLFIGGFWWRRRRNKLFFADLHEFDSDFDDDYGPSFEDDSFAYDRPSNSRNPKRQPSMHRHSRLDRDARNSRRRVNERFNEQNHHDDFDDFDSEF